MLNEVARSPRIAVSTGSGVNHIAGLGKMVDTAPERLGPRGLTRDHLGRVNKMVGANLGMPFKTDADCHAAEGLWMTNCPWPDSIAIEIAANARYLPIYIRPMAVRPLDHPERRPTPWGFLFSGFGKTRDAPLQRRSP